MSRVFWVRHGPTHATGMVGWRDLPADLSDRALIGRIAAHLPKDALVVSSDLQRSVATADAIAGARRRLPHEPDLREFDFGAWDGLVFDTISARDPVLSRRFWEEPGDVRAPDGESWNDLSLRAGRAIDRLLDAHPGRDIVAVAHFGTILTQLHRALGGEATAALAHRIDNFSVTDLRFDGRGWRVGLINHLP